MHLRSFLAANLAGGLALVFAVSVPLAAAAENSVAVGQPESRSISSAGPTVIKPAPPTTDLPGTSEPGSPQALTASPASTADPIIASIRAKLSDASLRNTATAADVAALDAFYAERGEPPVWITGMGFSAKAQAVISEIARADDWGLSASAFELPPDGDLPDNASDQADAEIKLQLAILKYARFARGGRADPSRLSPLFDQAPPLLEPKVVLTDIAASASPDAYLQSLHPRHEQFQRLRQALLKARGDGDSNAVKKPRNAQDIQRLLINMERWRWMPTELGTFYVQNNVPEFMVYVVKNGKAIHSDKIAVGTLRYATPIFSADMKTIVFNPEWTAPPTVVREDLLPSLRKGGGWFGGSSILRQHGLQVKYNGRVVDPGSINWNTVNVANIAFTQPPGPTNVLGKLKFLYPNKHVVYMHDTIKRDLFNQPTRAVGHNCIRMANPSRLAEILLAEDKGWNSEKIQELLRKGVDEAVATRPIPVHTTYFTAVVDDEGKVKNFADIYALDRTVAPVVVGKAIASVADDRSSGDATGQGPTVGTRVKPKAQKDSVAGSIRGLFGD